MLPVHAGSASPTAVPNIEIEDLFVVRRRVRHSESNAIDARDIDGPDAIVRGEVVHRFPIHGVEHGYAADADVVREEIQEASSRRSDPGAAAFRDWAFDGSAGTRKAQARASMHAVTAAFALCDL